MHEHLIYFSENAYTSVHLLGIPLKPQPSLVLSHSLQHLLKAYPLLKEYHGMDKRHLHMTYEER